MKRKFLIFQIVFSLLFVVTCFSQKSSLFLKAGLNLANVSISDNGSVDDTKMLTGFQAGLMGDLPLTSFLSVQPGLFFTGKGTKSQAGDETDASYYKAKTNPYYIELPVNLVFKLPVENAKFFVGAGPYAAMGVAGKNKAEGRIFGVAFSSEKNIEWSNDDPTTSGEEGAGFGIMRRFDYGLNGTIGIEGDHALFSVNYGFGLAKLQSGSDNYTDDANKHRVLSFTIGFKL